MLLLWRRKYLFQVAIQIMKKKLLKFGVVDGRKHYWLNLLYRYHNHCAIQNLKKMQSNICLCYLNLSKNSTFIRRRLCLCRFVQFHGLPIIGIVFFHELGGLYVCWFIFYVGILNRFAAFSILFAYVRDNFPYKASMPAPPYWMAGVQSRVKLMFIRDFLYNLWHFTSSLMYNLGNDPICCWRCLRG